MQGGKLVANENQTAHTDDSNYPVSMRQLLESGVHFGHQTRRWNPKMDPYIYTSRNDIHVIDLQQTVGLINKAYEFVKDTVTKKGSILFVGTKRSASELIAQAAINCGQYYVNHRWLGGMLTNWETVSKSIQKLKSLEERIDSGEINNLTKKERLNIERQKEKLDLTLGGIKNMNGIPDAIFIIDTNKEAIAVLEANNLNIPVIAVCDSNSNPSGVDFPIPGNDDALRAISLYCDLVAASVLKGLESNLELSGIDVGASEDLKEDNILVKTEEQSEDVLNISVDSDKV